MAVGFDFNRGFSKPRFLKKVLLNVDVAELVDAKILKQSAESY